MTCWLNGPSIRKTYLIVWRQLSDLTKSGTADRQDISQLTTKINEIQMNVSDGSDHSSGINFRAFSDENSDPSAWWRDFESCAEFKKYSEEKQLSALKVLLKGSAGVWLDRTLTNDIPDTDSCWEAQKDKKGIHWQVWKE